MVASSGQSKRYIKAQESRKRQEHMQDTSHEHSNLYERLMALSEEALVSAHYETAYHALTAAMHYATNIADEQRLAKVEQTAKLQQDWIDVHAPEHRMSSHSTNKHHNSILYAMLARQSAAQILIIQQNHRRDSVKRLPWLGEANEEAL